MSFAFETMYLVCMTLHDLENEELYETKQQVGPVLSELIMGQRKCLGTRKCVYSHYLCLI